MSIEDVVSKYKANSVVSNKLRTDKKGLSESFRCRLNGIAYFQPEMPSVTEKIFIKMNVSRCTDNENFPDSGQHQHRKGIIDHRLVINRKDLF